MMKNWLPYWIGASLALLLANCGSSSSTPVASTPDPPPADERPDPQPTPPPDQWLIPASQVRDGGPGKDGIPAIEHPQFDSGWAGAGGQGWAGDLISGRVRSWPLKTTRMACPCILVSTAGSWSTS